jgi:DNA-binding SARP family transcriptional activator
MGIQPNVIAKVCQPRVLGAYQRQRLYEMLDNQKDVPVSWICGPPGSGKTTFISTYVETRALKCAWHRVDEGDADPATFFYYLRLSLARLSPAVDSHLSLFTPEYQMGAEVFARRFFETIGKMLDDSAILVFDNFQTVSPESSIQALLNAGFSRSPPGLKIVVISRTDTPPQFSRMKANGQIGIIRWEDLRLTVEETASIVDQHLSPSVSNETKAQIYHKCGGWAAGLSLIIQCIQSKKIDYQSAVATTQEEIFGYFSEEIFNSADLETQNFLLKSSFLPVIRVDQAVALTNTSHAKKILHRLQRLNYFIFQTGEPDLSYSYHPLFREFLRAKAESFFSSDNLLALKKIAGNLLEEAGLIEEAVFLYFENGDYHSVIRIITQHAPEFLIAGRNRVLLDWLERIPDSDKSDSPWLLYWSGAARLGFEPLKSYRLFESAYYLSIEKQDMHCRLLSLSGILDSVFCGAENFKLFDHWLDLCDRLESEIEAYPDKGIQMRVAASMVTALIFRRPQHPKIAYWAKLFLAETSFPQDLPVTFHPLLQIAWHSAVFKADPQKARLILEELQLMTNKHQTYPLQILSKCVVEAILLAYFGDTAKVNQAVLEGLSLSQKSGVHIYDFMLMGHDTNNALNEYDVLKANTLLKIMEDWKGPLRFWDKSFYHFLRARALVISKDFQEAYGHANITMQMEDKIGSPVGQAITRMLLAQIQHALGEKAPANVLLEEAIEVSRKYKNRTFSLVALFFKAQFALAEGRTADAVAWLKRAGARAKRTGIINGFMDSPEATANLCLFAIENKIEVNYFTHVLRMRKIAPSLPPLHLDDWPWSLKIYTLGGFRIINNERAIGATRKAQIVPLRVLMLIIASGGEGVPEEQISDALWPEADGDAAHRAFSSAIYRLRKMLAVPEIIQISNAKVHIDRRRCWVDSWAFEKTARDALETHESFPKGDNAERFRRLAEKALSIYGAHFLNLESWAAPIISKREGLRDQFVRLAGRLGQYWEKKGQLHKAIEVYRRGVVVDEAAEKFYQRLMICHHRLGERMDALGVYARCKKALSDKVGIGPSAETESIHSMIIHQV